MADGEQVMSEVHVGLPPENASCLSLFTIASSPISDKHETLSAKNANPSNAANEYSVHDQPSDLIDGHVFVDENGDLVIPRRKLRRVHDVENHKDIISIHHRLKTSIPYVGLQIWRGSLLLGDFLLHKMQTTNELDNVVGLELGAGTGLVGILMAMKARLMFLTGAVASLGEALQLQPFRSGCSCSWLSTFSILSRRQNTRISTSSQD